VRTVSQRAPPGPLPTGTLTLLLSDVEGSTRLWEQHPESMRTALARHDELVEQAVTDNGGHVVRPRGEGDSRFAVFVRASDGIQAAARIQRALYGERWRLPAPLRIRIAVHTGEVDLRGGDYYGSTVNRCARMRDLARGGHVLVSSATHGLVRDRLPHELSLRSLGTHALRDLAEPEHVYQLVIAGLPDEQPPLAAGASIVAPVAPLIGRERDLEQLLGLVGNPAVRLTTLIGPGGVGKTRLALALAESLHAQFAAGHSFVDLSQVREPSLVWPSVARALGLRDEGQELLPELIQRHLRAQHRLLVLDNLEQVLDVAPSIAQLLEVCPQLKLIATSREPLRVRAEHTFEVGPLALPDAAGSVRPEAVWQSPAVRLLVERTQASDPAFQLTERNAAAVVELCARLDGLPLALELAASQLRVLPVEVLLGRLAERLNAPRGLRDMPRRHQSLRLAIDWSYELLDAPQQTLFRRLAAFSGGCSLAAAEAVCCVADDVSVLDGIVALVDRSLVRRIPGADGEARFTFLETIRDYAHERLVLSGEQTAIAQRHLEYCTELAEAGRSFLPGQAQIAWLDAVERDHDNIRAALRWAIDRHAAEPAVYLAGRVAKYWSARGAVVEGRAWLDAALSIEPVVESPARAAALMRAGNMAWQQADSDSARLLIEGGLRLARALNEPSIVASCLAQLGWIAESQGQTDQAVAYLEDSLASARQGGDRRAMAVAQHNLGCCWLAMGDVGRAQPALEQSLETFREFDDLINIADGLMPLGDIERRLGNHAGAEHYFSESLRIADQLSDMPMIASSLESIGGIACVTGRAERGVRLFAAADAIRSTIGVPHTGPERTVHEADLAVARAALGAERFAESWAAGQRLNREHAIEFALDRDELAPP
jgi:predicted ATPase/class 3 adenylate cyclase